VIVDLTRFVGQEKVYWTDLELIVERLERDPVGRMDVDEIKRFHYLYQRASADLVKVSGFSADAEIRRYLESLVGRSHTVVQGGRGGRKRTPLAAWLFSVFPVTFRRHFAAFLLSFMVVVTGAVVGSVIVAVDTRARAVILPFEHLKESPTERVTREERVARKQRAEDEKRPSNPKKAFSAFLMTHNTKVSIAVFAMGFTYGIGTIVMLFYNGLMLGAVALDYVAAGQSTFLLGWLLPHGVIEIPAVLIAGQAGILIAGALLGRGQNLPMAARLRRIRPDLMTLLVGLALMLVWAGIVEAFFSQYHEPIVPYAVKIALGVVELGALVTYLSLAGRPRAAVGGESRRGRVKT
jgi:uncharacterized membrane protein SpoIIM required for sporulation